ncbi:hypothetical protein [Nonlabens ulvanivorans]|uniref:hypothetical protein n=1 Tax=Nonlabens ulvanivorans TaxID=906888 RepID=UPI00135F19A7|nr:hypothetical protein [Nonlabens ulvanivorans]
MRVNYKLVTLSKEASFRELEKSINNHITDGWQPLWGVSIYDSGMAQAMVKYKSI